MPIVVNGVELTNDKDSLAVNQVAVQQVFLNDKSIWERTYKPEKPENFNATDDLYGEVVCTWNSAGDVTWYQLLIDGVPITPDEENIASPYTYIIEGQASFSVRAHNSYGYTDSEPDIGIGLVAGAGNVTIYYNSVSGANPETVSGGNGSFTFTTPEGIVQFYVSGVAGGGSGGNGTSMYFGTGGSAGQEISNNLVGTSTGQTHTITIGAGGGRGASGVGGSSSFEGSTTLGGGASGLDGMGMYVSNGAGSSYGSGGAGANSVSIAGDGGTGAGGGGGGQANRSGGAGGSGVTIITWG